MFLVSDKHTLHSQTHNVQYTATNSLLPYTLDTSQLGKVCQFLREINEYHSNIVTGLRVKDGEAEAVGYEGFSNT